MVSFKGLSKSVRNGGKGGWLIHANPRLRSGKNRGCRAKIVVVGGNRTGLIETFGVTRQQTVGWA